MSGTEVADHGEDDPCQRQCRDYEQDEDVGGGEQVEAGVVVDEPAQHSHDRGGDDDLEDSP